MDAEKVKNRLDYNSRERLSAAVGRIQRVLAIEDAWLDYMGKVNFWEWTIGYYWQEQIMSPKLFACVYFLITQIRKDGIKKPILIKMKKTPWELMNGHHRLAIAEVLEIDVPIKEYETKN